MLFMWKAFSRLNLKLHKVLELIFKARQVTIFGTVIFPLTLKITWRFSFQMICNNEQES